MPFRSCTSGLLLLTCLLFVADDARAWPLRFRSNSNRNYGGSSGGVRVAPKADPDSAGHRPLRVYYGYERAKELDVALADRIRVFLRVRDEQVANAKDGLVAEVKLTDLSNSATTHVKWCPVSFEGNAAVQNEELASFEVANEKDESVIQPQKVYRLFVNLHRKSDRYGEDTMLGRVPGPYYVATSGGTLLQQARQQIAMRTFREWYCTERGWPRDRGYRMDCHAYYLWATGFCTVGSSYGQANLGRLFRGRTPYRGGSEIGDLPKDDPIHGDYVRIPGHTFMLLAYDENLGRVWTMEGNFGSSIEIAIRSVGSGWQVGHLAEEHIRPDAFEATPENERGESLVATENPEQPAIE
jgi:hypothetical protein